jgi:hypothetical protein
MPVMLNNKKETIIHVLDRSTMNVQKYVSKEGFYIFHYANTIEYNNTIEIYASLYTQLDFSNLNIHGKYRKIIINKNTYEVNIIKNEELETMDLEFPIKLNNNNVILRSIKNKRITGFIICKDLEIIKTINIEKYYLSGEPALHYINNTPYLFVFAFDNNNMGTLLIIDMNTYYTIEIPINETINIGFHSTFIPKPFS